MQIVRPVVTITVIIQVHARGRATEVQINPQPVVVVDGLVEDGITLPAINPHSRSRVEGNGIGLSALADNYSRVSTRGYDCAGTAIAQGVGSTRIGTKVVVSDDDKLAPQDQNAGAKIAGDDVARPGRSGSG